MIAHFKGKCYTKCKIRKECKNCHFCDAEPHKENFNFHERKLRS